MTLILGATGLVGGYLMQSALRRTDAVTGTSFTQSDEKLRQLDLRDVRAVSGLLDELQPDTIIHAAADPNVEYIEEHPEETRAINVEPVRRIVSLLKGTKTTYVFFSSDYVFDGTAGPYREHDTPNPLSEYARQKVACEEMIQSAVSHWIIPRLTGVYGWERKEKNFVIRLIKSLTRGEKVRVPHDQIGNPTYAKNVADAVFELLGAKARGVYHVAGPERIDRYHFAEMVCSVFNLPSSLLVPVDTASLAQKAPRPLNAGLIVEKAQKLLSFPLLGPMAGLTAMRAERDSWLPTT